MPPFLMTFDSYSQTSAWHNAEYCLEALPGVIQVLSPFFVLRTVSDFIHFAFVRGHDACAL